MADFSSQSISDFGNDFSIEPNLMQCTLKMIAFYQARDCSQISQDYGTSHIIAKTIVDNLIQNGANQLYDEYIDKKINGHTIGLTSDLLDRVLIPEILPHEEVFIEPACDQEPVYQFR